MQRAIDYVIAIIAPHNTPSIRMAERAGLRFWKHADSYGKKQLIYRVKLSSRAADHD
jgi:RimJ/RimL family protein N-acetyltransferase